MSGEGCSAENQQTGIIDRASTVCCYGVLSGQVHSAHPQCAEDYWLAKGHFAKVKINIGKTFGYGQSQCILGSTKRWIGRCLVSEKTDSPLLFTSDLIPPCTMLFHLEEGIPRHSALDLCTGCSLYLVLYSVLHLQMKSLLHFESSNSVCLILSWNLIFLDT